MECVMDYIFWCQCIVSGVSLILAALVYLILYVILLQETTVEQMHLGFPMGKYVVKVLDPPKVFR